MGETNEYPSILPAGFHKMTPSELKQLTVAAFPLSKRRPALWKSLEFVLQALHERKIPCDVWVDGSFLTKKIDPNDIDLIFELPVEIVEAGNEDQKAFVENLSDQLYRKSDDLHSFVMFKTPTNHPLYSDMLKVRQQWERDFGFSYTSKEAKGIALIEVRP